MRVGCLARSVQAAPSQAPGEFPMSNPRNGRTIRIPVQRAQGRLLTQADENSRPLLDNPVGGRPEVVDAKPALEDAGAGSELRARIEELRDQVSQLEDEIATWKSKAREWKAEAEELEQQVSSLGAEVEDWKARVAKLHDRESDVRRQAAHQARFQTNQERERLLKRLLSVADDLERALKHANVNDPLQSGVRIILKDVLGQLKQEGVEPIQVLGHRFDPNLHEAVASDGSGGDQVVKVVRAGYALNGNLLRPAQVVVGRLTY
jgi:molecular chaperone GrpE